MKNKLLFLSVLLISIMGMATPVDNPDVIHDGKNIVGGKKQDINSTGSIIIGDNANVSKNGVIVIGKKTKVEKEYGITIGNYAVGNSNYGVTIGGSSRNFAYEKGTVVGYNSKGNGGVVVGTGITSMRGYNVIIGDGAVARQGNTIAVGDRATSLREDSVTIGVHARNMGESAIAIGRRAYSFSNHAISIGEDSSAISTRSINMGNFALNEGYESVNIGTDSKTHSNYSVTLGNRSVANSYGSIALGSNTKANRNAYVEGYNPVEEDVLNFSENNAEKIEELKKKQEDIKFLNGLFSEKTSSGSINDELFKYINNKNERDFKLLEDKSANVTTYDEKINESKTKIIKILKKKCEGHEENKFCKIDFSSMEIEEIIKKYEGAQNDLDLYYRRASIPVSNIAAVSTRGALSIGDVDSRITRQIIGVAAGSEDTDAVNVFQLKQLKKYTDKKIDVINEKITEMSGKFEKIENDINEVKSVVSKDVKIINAGVSSGMAMSAINKIGTSSNSRFAIGAGVGAYNKGYSVALGLSGMNKNRTLTYNANLSLNNTGNLGFSAGLSYEFNNKNNNLEDNIKDINKIIEMNKKLMEENNELKEKLEFLIKKLNK